MFRAIFFSFFLAALGERKLKIEEMRWSWAIPVITSSPTDQIMGQIIIIPLNQKKKKKKKSNKKENLKQSSTLEEKGQ